MTNKQNDLHSLLILIIKTVTTV